MLSEKLVRAKIHKDSEKLLLLTKFFFIQLLKIKNDGTMQLDGMSASH